MRKHKNGNLSRLHNKCLPEHLRTFNYKVHFSLLPLNTKFSNYSLDTDSRCHFCKWGPENEWHIFGKCQQLKRLWEAMDEVIKLSLGINYSFTDNRI